MTDERPEQPERRERPARPAAERPERPERPARVKPTTEPVAAVQPTPELAVLLNELAAVGLGDDIQVSPRPDGWAQVNVPANRLVDVCRMLRDSEKLQLNFLSSISAVDWKDQGFSMVYHLISVGRQPENRVVIRVDLPDREHPEVPSVVEIWPTANWHEREAFDMMGIQITNHPGLRRILMREDWVGHPLRKDYVDPRIERDRVTHETYTPGVYTPAIRGDKNE